jgi:hypothetical protein
MTAKQSHRRPHIKAEACAPARAAVGLAAAIVLAVSGLLLSAAPTDPDNTGSPPPSAQLTAARSGTAAGLDATTITTTIPEATAPEQATEPSWNEITPTPTGTTSAPTDDTSGP